MRHLVLAILLSSCATMSDASMTADLSDAALRTQCDELDARLTQAAHGGAARCAPEAFGVAQANREFARMELVAGNRQRAKQHLDVAATALAQSTPCR